MAFRQIKSPALADQAVITSKVDVTAVSGQTAATSLISADEFLIHDTANGALKKITSANLIGSYTTDDMGEGSTNLYYTDARVESAVDAYLVGGTGVTIASGNISIGQDVSTTANVTFNNVTVDGSLSTDDITAANVTASGNMIVAGNLTVQGTTTSVDSNTVEFGDAIIELNKDATSGAIDAGIEVQRGTDGNVSFIWDETNDVWTTGGETLRAGDLVLESGGQFTGDLVGDVTGNVTGNLTGNVTGNVTGDLTGDVTGNLTGDVTGDVTGNLTGDVTGNVTGDLTGDVTGTVSDISNHDTDALAEGSTNLYFTDGRADARIAAASVGDLSDVDITSIASGNTIVWNGTSFETADHFDGADFNTEFGNKTTDDLSEGATNLYFTNGRARTAISVTGDLAYNAGTGVISFTERTDAEVIALARNNLSASNAGTGFGALSYDSATGDFEFDKVTSADIRGELSAVDAGGDGSFSYDSATGVMTYTGPSAAEAQAHFSAANTGSGHGNLAYANGVFTYTKVSSTDITGEISAVNNGNMAIISYDTATGEIASSLSEGDIEALFTANNSGTFAHNLTYSAGAFDLEINESDIIAVFSGGTGVTLAADGDISIGRDVATTANVTFNDGQFDGDVTVEGDLTVKGTMTSINSNEVNIGDAVILLNSDETGAASQDAGFEVERGTDTNVSFLWDEGNDRWTLGSEELYTSGVFRGALIGNVSGQVTDVSNHDTDDLAEGATNLYFTEGRARTAISVTDAGGDGSLAYNAGTGVITYTGPSAAEVQAHFSGGTGVTYAAGVISIGQDVATSAAPSFAGMVMTGNLAMGSNSITGLATPTTAGEAANKSYVDGEVATINSTISGLDTDSVAEGSSNLYFTDGRADARIAAASIDDLSDVNVTGIADGQIMVWDAAAGEFVTGSLSGLTSVLGLSDVADSSFTGKDDYILQVNEANGEMELVDPATVVFGSYNRVTLAGNNTTTYSLGFSADDAYAQVFVGGVIQDPTTHYTITGSSITFSSAIPAGTQAVVINPVAASVPTLQAGSVSKDKLASDIKAYVQKTAVSAGTSATAVDTFDGTLYRSAKYIIQVENNGEYETREALVVHDGTSAYITEYALVYTGSALLGDATVSVNGTDIELNYQAASGTATVKVIATYIDA